MSWFHLTKQERLKASIAGRREQAEVAQQHAAENLFLIPHDIAPALRAALAGERTFEEYFGEPMPTHMRHALDLEISFWQHLNEQVEHLRADRVTDADYDQGAEGARRFLVVLIDLLHTEEEMVTSCLQQHYLDLLQSLQARAAAVRL